MDLKVASVILCLCALAITSTEAGIPRCCISVKNDIPTHILLKVWKWSMQRSNGACDIRALILHVKYIEKPICADPKLKKTLTELWAERKMQQRWKRSRQKASY